MTSQEPRQPEERTYSMPPYPPPSTPEIVWPQLPDDSQLSPTELRKKAELTASDRGFIPPMESLAWPESFWGDVLTSPKRLAVRLKGALAITFAIFSGEFTETTEPTIVDGGALNDRNDPLARFVLSKTPVVEPPTQQTPASVDSVQTTELRGVYEKPNSWYEVVVNDDEQPSEYRIFDVDLKPPQDER